MVERYVRYLDRGFLMARVSIYQDEIRRWLELLRFADGARGGDDTPATLKQRLCEAKADSAGSAGDDGDGLLGDLHRMSFWLRVSVDITFFKNELLRMSVLVLRTI
jgi:hypothetical protein